MHKQCPECGEHIKGRSDKKFCSDPCRNAHNNRLNSDYCNHMRTINNTLRRNRRILSNLSNGKITKLPLKQMLLQGFDLTYHTHIHTTPKGENYFFCYEYGYQVMENNCCIIIKK